MAKHLLIESAKVNFAFTPVVDHEQLKVGNVSIEVIHTPGHTMESTSFKLGDDALFTGDTLFVDGVGRLSTLLMKGSCSPFFSRFKE